MVSEEEKEQGTEFRSQEREHKPGARATGRPRAGAWGLCADLGHHPMALLMWLGKSFASMLPPEDLPSIMELHNRAIQGETPPIFTVRVLTKAGEYVKGEVMTTLEVKEGKVV